MGWITENVPVAVAVKSGISLVSKIRTIIHIQAKVSAIGERHWGRESEYMYFWLHSTEGSLILTTIGLILIEGTIGFGITTQLLLDAAIAQATGVFIRGAIHLGEIQRRV